MAKTNEAETIIARGVRVEGDFVSEGDILIEGEVKGSIKTSGDLRVGEDAKINATVEASNANVSGEIQGNVKIANRLEMTASALIIGDLATSVLSMAAGAKLNGTIKMDGAVAEVEEEEVDDE